MALAERKANKGQETANIKLGTDEEEEVEDTDVVSTTSKPKISNVSQTLGLGSGKTGVQT